MLEGLLRDIKKQSTGYETEIIIVDDHSTANYKPVRHFLKNNFNQSSFQSNTERFGKAGFWKTINKGFGYARKTRFDYFFELPDDVRLVNNYFDRAIDLFNSQKDAVCVNLLTEYSRDGKRLWTRVESERVSPEMYRTGWVDMCYISKRKFLKLLNFTINEVSTDWANDPTKSSGVGMQISKRIVNSGHRFHQVKQSLVIHDDHPSMMHPNERKKNKLITNHRKDNTRKTASLASMPDRENSLKQVINSIYHQVDEINVYLNDYQHVPGFLMKKGISVFRSQDEIGDLGDVGKFYRCESIHGYHFTMDDDLIYPPDYIETLIKNIEENGREMVVSFHGRIFNKFPIRSYYHSYSTAVACLKDWNDNIKAHVLGTGVLGYHTDTLKVDLADFKTLNMSDIWFGVICEKQNIERLIIQHPGGWIRHTKIELKKTIAAQQHNRDGLQTNIMNTHNWKKIKAMAHNEGLMPEVANKYYVSTIKPGKYNFKNFGDIDLRLITLATADKLFQKGFPFLKLKRPVKTAQPPAQTSAPESKPAQPATRKIPPEPLTDVDAYRKNKDYINKLLTMNWETLEHKEKLIFNSDHEYFLEKKKAFFTIAALDRQMKSKHAKMRALPEVEKNNPGRAGLLKDISTLDGTKTELWAIIDTWEEPLAPGTEAEKIEKAKKEALESDRKAKADSNYIWRAERELMKESISEARRKYLIKEIARRKQNLIDQGKPYNRKTRK